jgi:hypothetical protein
VLNSLEKNIFFVPIIHIRQSIHSIAITFTN